MEVDAVAGGGGEGIQYLLLKIKTGWGSVFEKLTYVNKYDTTFDWFLMINI